ncbi:MAG: hypothetical protein U0934_01925 [Pseudotabrizicola sp.]|uniref:hypothetical protein n=1 Tax=Pseudotabrizicola sp. TaxID=2939647 RepID=UPI002719E3D9|nr:hypothetical protein [Pseudotabrizicola sp.]MDO8884007.1 hypothetical protein [Pseudotabrizicola sp.]MDP2080898.1 hypothetical protein [Pseudotabrizicola sp.]MDZ7572700.1 hypothetical protein [Pseudotabrizicola sp.]
MKRPVTAALVAVLVLTSCGPVRDSRLNPFNWFGRSERVETISPLQEKRDPRLLVADVVSLTIEPYSGGAIVRATGVMETQGWWQVELVEVKGDDPTHLVLDFRTLPPVTQTAVGTVRSREVTAAMTVSPRRLEDISRITVQGERSARTTRR